MPSLAERYAASIEQLERAERTIPLASQTFSKSRTQYPVGAAPLFAQRAKCSHTWDIDGNEYVDLVGSLGAVALGYGDEEINQAAIRQPHDGVTLSLAHPLEAEVAERITALVPCAEMVRFGKNGTDATSAAVRLACAATGREHVIVCGYHGWQDWYIGTTSMNRGLPERTQSLSHSIPYNDIEALESTIADHPGQIAAMIMEPMTSTWPKKGYLEAVRRITLEHDIVLVFDEMLTGFRFAPGEPTRTLADLGTALTAAIEAVRPEASREFLTFSGHPSWVFQQWSIDDPETLAQAKTLLLQEMLRRGVLVLNTHEVTTTLTRSDLEQVAQAYKESLEIVGSGLAEGSMPSLLECEPIRPLFRVRS